MKRILCLIGRHDWKYHDDWKYLRFPRHTWTCKRCDKKE